MKMIYGGTPVKNLNIVKHDVSTNDATVMPSDLQAGVSCYARGQKVIGTGRSFEFAYYGDFETNDFMIIPAKINVIHLSSVTYPMQDIIKLDNNMSNLDFSTEQVVSNIIVDGELYPVKVISTDNEINILCDKTVTLQVFYGKDNYV